MSTSYPGGSDRPPDEIHERAERIVEDLVFGHSADPDAVGDVPLADVEDDAFEFAGQLQLMEQLELDMPAYVLENGNLDGTADDPTPVPTDLVPISVDHLVDRRLVESDPDQFRKRVLDAYQDAHGIDETFVSVPPPVAQEHFQRRLADFLTVRIRASGDSRGATGWPGALLLWLPLRRGGAPTTVPGCLFEVTTNTPGLDSHWSGAYWISWNNFGQTTPAQGMLQSGTYLFSVNGGPYKKKFQKGTSTVTLPGTPSVHLNY